jgi:hypothetical protein
MSTKSKVFHITPRPDGWASTREGGERASIVAPTQDQALRETREIAQREGGRIIIHGENGQFREERSYGTDPFPPKG